MQRWIRRSSELVFIALVTATCQRTTDSDSAVPHLDQQPPPETANGEIVGADNKSPQHLLAEQGTTGHPAPGWKIDRNGVSYDPKRQPPENKGATRITDADGGVEVVPQGHEPVPTPVPEE